MRTPRISRPLSLKWRLTAWVAAVMIASAAAVFVVVYLSTGSSLENQVDIDLRGDVDQLAQALRPYAHRSAAEVDAAAARYVRAQPFTASSTLLFVLPTGGAAGAPVSNHPEVFGRASADDGESQAEQAAENHEGARLKIPHAGFSTEPLPDVGNVRVLERATLLGGQQMMVGAGEPLASVHTAQHEIARAFILAGVLALALALVASYLAGVRVTAPLRRMAAVAARVDGGDLEPRMQQTPSSAEEVGVLADAFNHMLDRLAVAFEAQREFIADASHELRTPLTVVRGQLEVLAASDNVGPDEIRRVERVVQAEVTRMTRLVDDLLLLTAAEGTDFLRLEPVDLREFVTELWDGLELTADRRFELGPLPDGVIRADPDRLAQALRNLARNAIDHTAPGNGLVRLEGAPLPGDVLRLSVIDDGPGIPEAERERVFERLYRTDRSRSRVAGGAGLGLSIVRAIAEAHGGGVQAGAGPAGRGARIDLILPGFRTREPSPSGSPKGGSASQVSG